MNFTETINAATAAPDAAINNQVETPVSGSTSAPGAAINNQVQTPVSGSTSAPAASLLGGPSISASTVAPSASVSKSITHPIPAVTLPQAATVSKSITHPLTGATAAPAASLTKRISHIITASAITWSAILTKRISTVISATLSFRVILDALLLRPSPLRLALLAVLRRLATIRTWSWGGEIGMMQFTQDPAARLVYRQEIDGDPVLSAVWTLTRADTGAVEGTLGIPTVEGSHSDVAVSGLTDGVDYLLQVLITTSTQIIPGKALIACRSLG